MLFKKYPHGNEITSKNDKIDEEIGGSAWESNPPGTVLAPHTGFEVDNLK